MAQNNAVIWYAEDGYDPTKKGLNGRRVAGASFLKGFFNHADVDSFVSLTKGVKGEASFAAKLKESGRTLPHRNVFMHEPRKMQPLGTIYFPSPNFADQLWMRQRFGAEAWSLCGITHTTATTAVMQGMFDLRAAPQMPWDGVICTSRAVHAATNRNLDLADQYLKERFGHVPPRPQMPVIPLGITCDDFARSYDAAKRLRTRMGWGENDIVVATLSRLLPYGKFDPAPLFVALQDAQTRLAKPLKLHFLACGIYGDSHSQNTFESCAEALMPDVSFTHLDGADAEMRAQTLSGADIFTFPIDNIQETFGLAPIEAMAAGLPVLCSDWDGMRDTITEDVGIRIPTTTVSGRHTGLEAWRYHCGRHSYAQYTNNASAMTALDMAAMSNALVTLASDAELRKRMGAAGQNRARMMYDWSVIIPQMQSFWAELHAIRTKALENPPPRTPSPMGPSPMSLFASYPTQQIAPDKGRFQAVATDLTVKAIFEARRYEKLGQFFEPRGRIERTQEALVAAGQGGVSSQELAEATGLPAIRIERICVFLMKFGLAEFRAK